MVSVSLHHMQGWRPAMAVTHNSYTGCACETSPPFWIFVILRQKQKKLTSCLTLLLVATMPTGDPFPTPVSAHDLGSCGCDVPGQSNCAHGHAVGFSDESSHDLLCSCSLQPHPPRGKNATTGPRAPRTPMLTGCSAAGARTTTPKSALRTSCK